MWNDHFRIFEISISRTKDDDDIYGLFYVQLNPTASVLVT